MTARRLWLIVAAVIVLLAVYAGAAAIEYSKPQTPNPYFKDFIPLVVSIAAAILTAAFQRRISYLQALRDLWRQLLPAIQTVIQYTHLETPDNVAYTEAQKGISIAIDAVRGVFRNTHAGLYPFENLKDIHRVLGSVAPDSKSTPERLAIARRVITRLWQETHSAMLLEFDCADPVQPVSKYLCHGRSIADYFVTNVLTESHLEKSKKPSCPESPPRERSEKPAFPESPPNSAVPAD